MILVLCEEADSSALWAADALRARGLPPVVLGGADLASVKGWRHVVDPRGAASAELRLARGERLRSADVRATLNRLPFVPRSWSARVGGPDRDYALQEMHAFYLSWLHALPGPKLNPPTPQGLCGNMRHPSAWRAMAARAGLPVRPWRQSEADDPGAFWQARPDPAVRTAIVVGTSAVGPDDLIGPHGTACLRLAEAAGCPLLGVNFAPGADGAQEMTGASVMPPLWHGGDAVADALAKALAP